MDDRELALRQVVSLAREHDLSVKEITAALAADNPESSTSAASRIFAYVGGIFILCGLGFFIETWWWDMNAAARIILHLGSGLVALVLALCFMGDGLYRRAAIPLFLLAALFQSSGIMVAFDELGTGGDPALALLVMSLVMLAQCLLVNHAHRLTLHVFLALVFAAVGLGNLFELLDADRELAIAITGAGLLAAGYRLDRTDHNSIVPFWFLVGGVMTSYGIFDLLERTPADILYIGYAGLLIWFSTLAKSRTLLFVGTCAMIGYLAWFTGEYFADSVGWPVTLMIIGAIFIGMSVFAVKISRDYIGRAG